MSDHIERIIDALAGCCSECADRAEHIAHGINEHAPAGLLASPTHDAAVAARALRDAATLDFTVAAQKWLHDRADRIESEGGVSDG